MQFFRLAKIKLLLLAKKKEQKHRISQTPKQGLCQGVFKNTFLRSVAFVDCLLIAAASLQRKKLNPHPIQDTQMSI